MCFGGTNHWEFSNPSNLPREKQKGKLILKERLQLWSCLRIMSSPELARISNFGSVVDTISESDWNPLPRPGTSRCLHRFVHRSPLKYGSFCLVAPFLGIPLLLKILKSKPVCVWLLYWLPTVLRIMQCLHSILEYISIIKLVIRFLYFSFNCNRRSDICKQRQFLKVKFVGSGW